MSLISAATQQTLAFERRLRAAERVLSAAQSKWQASCDVEVRLVYEIRALEKRVEREFWVRAGVGSKGELRSFIKASKAYLKLARLAGEPRARRFLSALVKEL